MNVVERAEQLTRERIAQRAGDYDVAGANPVESWRDLWREGLLAGTIPTGYGGLGLGMATYVAGIRAGARGCARTPLTLHMHSTLMRVIDAPRTGAPKRRDLGEGGRDRQLLGSLGSGPA